MSNVFPNVWVVLQSLLTLPITVVSGKWSFSKLKLIKMYLQFTMADKWLTSLGMLSIGTDIDI
jgi:hypothetical protein